MCAFVLAVVVRWSPHLVSIQEVQVGSATAFSLTRIGILTPSIIVPTSDCPPLVGVSASWMSSCLQVKIQRTVIAHSLTLVAENLSVFSLNIFFTF